MAWLLDLGLVSAAMVLLAVERAPYMEDGGTLRTRWVVPRGAFRRRPSGSRRGTRAWAHRLVDRR